MRSDFSLKNQALFMYGPKAILSYSMFFFSPPLRSDRGRFSRLLFFSSLSLLLFVFFGCSDGMEREACVCDHGFERSDFCAEIIIIIIIIIITILLTMYYIVCLVMLGGSVYD